MSLKWKLSATVLSGTESRIAASLEPASGSSGSNILRGEAAVALREIFAREGIRESCSAEQEGMFVTLEGHDELSLRYNLPEYERFSLDAAAFRKAKADLVRCSSILAEQGFPITLIVSPRTLALFVRLDPESEVTNSGSYRNRCAITRSPSAIRSVLRRRPLQ